jgi:hypothetical protein
MTVDSRSLFQAIAQSNLKAVHSSLRSGANPNAGDMYAFTPIHYAALRDQPITIEYLIKAKANPHVIGGPLIELSKRDKLEIPHLSEGVPVLHPLVKVKNHEQSSPLLLAAWYANVNAMRVLVKYLPPDFSDGDKPNAYGFSINYCVLVNQLHQFSERFPPTKYTHEIHRAKMLAHANGINGHLSLRIRGEMYEFPLEGGLTYGMYKEIADSLEEIPFEDPIFSQELKREIIEVLRKASRRRPARELLAEIQQGKLTILPTGQHGHYQSIIFYRSHMFMIDGANEQPVRYFQFEPDALTEEHIENVLWGHANLSEPGGPLQFLLTENPTIFPRLKEHVMKIKKQSIGNCSHYAAKHAFRAAFKLLSEILDRSPRTLEVWKFVKDWSTYFRITQLKKYLVFHRTQMGPEIPEDHDLVQLSWAKIQRHAAKAAPLRQPFFQKELESLSRFWLLIPKFRPDLPREAVAPLLPALQARPDPDYNKQKRHNR